MAAIERIPAAILTAETVPAYLKARWSQIGCFAEDAVITVAPILGGNVNYAFCATCESTGTSVFVKQAPEFVAIFGPDGLPLSSARMQLEVDIYDEWRAALGPELEAKFLPRIFHFDNVNMVFVMEFFGTCDLLEKQLISTGTVGSIIAVGLGDFMGRTHAASFSKLVSPERAAALTTAFENRDMRDVQLEFVFTKCYAEAEAAAALRADAAFMAEIEQLKTAYDGQGGGGHSLTHGDLHPGSVMVDEAAGLVKIIDPEFTVYGPPGLDVGSLLSGFILAAIHHKFSGTAGAPASIRRGVAEVWEAYRQALNEEGGVGLVDVAAIEVETVGYTLAEVCRTALGCAGGRVWLKFEDEAVQSAAVEVAMGIVQRGMVGRHVRGMSQLLDELDSLV
eukprot:CAMPEP_0185781504 /NCGR_PEP_ID=MMETSP1174-20130828/102671_1 /TAXON_ID=35687 /ORGANISM="Dictyocha speculum, Strain CCMP1381" /LENGTH=392 /DNA_ID=CAMNT_0028471513 /DNA_START=13 /DNA_END=1191 /DNA_ORIENTATION=+